MKIVAIRDIRADGWLNPVYTASLGGAIRSFGDECLKKDNNPLAQHPEDYELYHLGEWHSEKGEFEILKPPKQIAVGSNQKDKESKRGNTKKRKRQ